jgi:hypothetical protein
MVDMQFVESSNIEQVGYDGDAMELHVQFKNSGLYVFSEVPEHIYQALMAADSKGSFFNREIKKLFKFEKR